MPPFLYNPIMYGIPAETVLLQDLKRLSQQDNLRCDTPFAEVGDIDIRRQLANTLASAYNVSIENELQRNEPSTVGAMLELIRQRCTIQFTVAMRSQSKTWATAHGSAIKRTGFHRKGIGH